MPKKSTQPNSSKKLIVEPIRPPQPSTSKMLMIDDILDSMDCPICLEFLQSPIYMCGTGHNICGNCRKKLHSSACPMCKSPITDQRNFSLEAISSKMLIPCPNTAYGCSLSFPVKQIDSHANVCKFKPFLCPLGRELGKCTYTKLTILNLEQHFIKQHPKHSNLIPNVELQIPNFDPSTEFRDLKLVVYENSVFFYHYKIDPIKEIAYWTVQWAGSQGPSPLWKYEFSFNDERGESNVTFSAKCNTLHKTSEEIFKNGKCVAIPLQVLKNFLREKNLHFKFSIQPMAMQRGRSEMVFHSKKGKQRSRSAKKFSDMKVWGFE